MKLGIIGTAGRGTDIKKLNKNMWDLMLLVCNNFKILLNPSDLVSGGAAWADSLATEIFLSDQSLGYNLFLPCSFKNSKFVSNDNTASTANYYHKKFSDIIEDDFLKKIEICIQNFRCTEYFGKGFHERNTKIAETSDVLLAFTFGDGKILKDGGTNDTMKKYLNLSKKEAYHFCLNQKKLFKLV